MTGADATRRTIGESLSPSERRAAAELVRRIRSHVQAELIQASLFGSKARGDARPDSDVDLLLVFRQLPWDREPQASQAEALAEMVADRTGIPVTVWSVSLVDLERGNRTPMLVDALEDSIPFWYASGPLPALPFTRDDALRCVGALLERLAEGGEEFARHRRDGDRAAAARRARDDLVRMCTATLLLEGITRPRRAEALRAVLQGERMDADAARVLRWAIRSYGESGKDEERPVPLPPGGLDAAARVIDQLAGRVERRAERLARLSDGR